MIQCFGQTLPAVPMAQRSLNGRCASPLTSQASGHVMAEVVEVEVPQAEPPDQSPEGPANMPQVHPGQHKGVRLVGQGAQCGQQRGMQGDRGASPFFVIGNVTVIAVRPRSRRRSAWRVARRPAV